MRYPVDDFKTAWNGTAGYAFGAKTSYGYHEGIDINDNQGGNSDLGKPLYAIADGEITSVHDHATNYGKHIHLKIDGPWGTRWIHYAHCQEMFVKVGDKVTEGQKIATVGNSGTQYAHCHFACKKQPTGIDAIATTLDQLQMWEDPISFIESNLGQQTVDQQTLIDQLRADRDKNWNLYQQEQSAKIALEDAVAQKQKTIDSMTKTAIEMGASLNALTEENQSLLGAVQGLKTELSTVRADKDKALLDLSICKSQRKDLAKYTSSELKAELKSRIDVSFITKWFL